MLARFASTDSASASSLSHKDREYSYFDLSSSTSFIIQDMADLDPDLDPDTGPDLTPDLDSDQDPDLENDLENDLDLDPDTDLDHDTDLGPDLDFDTDHDHDLDPDPDPNTDPEVRFHHRLISLCRIIGIMGRNLCGGARLTV